MLNQSRSRLLEQLVVGVTIAILLIFAGLYFWPNLATDWLMGFQQLRQVFGTQADTIEQAFLPCILVGITALFLQLLNPKPKTWSRVCVAALIFVLAVRYNLWRILHTLNLDHPLNALLSIVLLTVEMLSLWSAVLNTCLGAIRVERSREADRYEALLQSGAYQPTVDVIIPTYNEPAEILRRTVVGCQAMDYPHKQVYLLDDLRRPEIRALAQELGCGYRDRPDNKHAKAGNINHALPSLSGELLAVFDADYVPSRNFLSRTVGFFIDAKVAMVQTPQNFFNDDPVTTNLGLSGIVNNEQDFFFRYIQPSRDAFNAVICCGSCFVVRREPLDAIGGIPTESIAEDMMTSIKLQSLGYRLKYLNEALSAGMSAENMTTYTNQRLRWGRGTLQSIFCPTNPITMPGLSFWQRLYHTLSLVYWTQSVFRVMFFLVPSLYFLFEIVPLKTTAIGSIEYFLPFYLLNVSTFSWLTGGWRSMFWSEVYEILLCVPMSKMVISTLMKPFGQGFKVTDKGITNYQITPNWPIMRPLLVLMGISGVSTVYFLLNKTWRSFDPDQLGLNLVWVIYNLILLGIGMLCAIDVPQRRHPRFTRRYLCTVKLGDRRIRGETIEVSESGATVLLGNYPAVELPERGELHFEQVGLDGAVIPVAVRWARRSPQGLLMGLEMVAIPAVVYRPLIADLFCRSGQWQDNRVPEYRTIWAFLRTCLRLYPLAESR
jgi:cellulose synthase (UDP-forming)